MCFVSLFKQKKNIIVHDCMWQMLMLQHSVRTDWGIWHFISSWQCFLRSRLGVQSEAVKFRFYGPAIRRIGIKWLRIFIAYDKIIVKQKSMILCVLVRVRVPVWVCLCEVHIQQLFVCAYTAYVSLYVEAWNAFTNWNDSDILPSHLSPTLVPFLLTFMRFKSHDHTAPTDILTLCHPMRKV